jgi:hypothetical protein
MSHQPMEWTVASSQRLPVRRIAQILEASTAALLIARLLSCSLCIAGQPTSADRVQSLDRAEFFEREVRPLLIARCHECHGTNKSEAHLRLTSRDSILKGGESGPAVVPGKPKESRLCNAVDYVDEPRMPPSGKLPAGEIATLKRWVAMGLPWPQSPAPAQSATTAARAVNLAEARRWWAFQPLRRAVPPTVREGANILTPIDRFVQERIEGADLEPFPAAERRVLIRRATFDLIGLPPTPDEVDAFVNDPSPDAFAKVVDRLLASPQYGERWGRHWLDVVRYSDCFLEDPKTHGSSSKFEIFEAYRYRDWVVRSFNGDLPYDQFVMNQIAGDQLADHHGRSPNADGLIATTVLAIGAWDNGDADKDKVVSDIVDDQINVIGQAFLGLTVACARCHDHKFDPVSTKDYYALAGMFYSSHVLANVGTKGDHTVLLRLPLASPDYLARRQKQLDRLAQLKLEIAKLNRGSTSSVKASPRRAARPVRPKVSAVHRSTSDPKSAIGQLAAERDALERSLLPAPSKSLGIQDGGTPGGMFTGIQDVPVHFRGSYTRLGERVPRRLPEFFAGPNQPLIRQGSGRLELARWVSSPNNPLTARVLVNRVWQGHFGEGLVGTPNNFGKLGDRPTHPELLDWLSSEFIRSGWSIKFLHRLIMNSAVYQRASSLPAGQRTQALLITKRDPDNHLLARYVPRRLEAECLRDAMLAASGRLDRRSGGPAGPNFDGRRRSLYVQTPRWTRAYFSTLFDAADPDQTIGKRNVTAVAPQALFFLNHPFVRSQAETIATRVLTDSAASHVHDASTFRAHDKDHSPVDDLPHFSARLADAYQLLFSRMPTAEEAAIGADFLRGTKTPDGRAAWADLIQILLSDNEFCYVD